MCPINGLPEARYRASGGLWGLLLEGCINSRSCHLVCALGAVAAPVAASDYTTLAAISSDSTGCT